MLQFYFLSVLLNVVGGSILASDFLEKKISFFGGVTEVFRERANSKLFLGILAFIVGVFKILTVTAGDVKVVGDLLPALSGLLIGIGLIAEYYRTRTDVHTENNINTLLDKYKHIFGSIAILIGVLHFIFPRVLFL